MREKCGKGWAVKILAPLLGDRRQASKAWDCERDLDGNLTWTSPHGFTWTAKAADILEKVKRARKALDIG